MLIKIKNFFQSKQGTDFMLGLLLILSMTVSFLLGRFSKGEENAIIIESIEKQNTLVNPLEYTIDNVAEKIKSEGGQSIVASKRGSKYYYVWCSGAKSLSPANKIYFDSESGAEKAGYTLSTSCKK